MIQFPFVVAVNRRALTGLALGLWIIVLSLLSLRVEPSGPQWDVQLSAAAADGTTLVQNTSLGLGMRDGLRPGDVVYTIDGQDASALAGQSIPATAREITFRRDDGKDATVRYSQPSGPMLALLWSGALLFVAVGGIVYRWSADAALGKVFLALAASFATTLAVVPLANLGYLLANQLSGAAALAAGPCLLTLFLMFPRRVRRLRSIAFGLFAVTAVLYVTQLVEPALPQSIVLELDFLAWLWTMVTLVAALVVLGLRMRHAPDRRALSPLVGGTIAATVPMIIYVCLTQFFGVRVPVDAEVVAISMAAIPISFAYSILRFQVFGLDVLMRRVLVRGIRVALSALVFFAVWLALQALGLSSVGAALFAVVACGLCMPTLGVWAARYIDGWLYQPLSKLSASPEADLSATLADLGNLVTARLREVLPVQWAACLIHDDTTPVDSASRRLLGADGQLPRWLDGRSSLEQSPTEVSVTLVHRFDTGVVLLLAGPRVDGGRLDGIQLEAMRLLAGGVGPNFEAGLLRERAEDEAAFRQGVTELARGLAAAATVNDVLRTFSTHAERLLEADSAVLDWLPRDQELIVEDEDPNLLQLILDNTDGEPLVCTVRRSPSGSHFGSRERGRAHELAEHATGALRRAAEREVLEDQLRHRAFYDSLTGLPNRALLLDRIHHATARADRNGHEVAVLFVDLDRFKVVNDSLGHSAGDQLLVQVTQRLGNCLRESDTIARLGGDEFTVLLEGPTALSDAVTAAQRILATLQEPFVIEGQETFASTSIGIAGGAGVREAGRDLLREADIALYRAKAGGRGRYAVYDAQMHQLPGEYLHLESDLHRAIERRELRVHYQPIFSLQTSEVSGFEALIRWEHPEKGMIQPGQFIPLAEDTGLIVPIGKWVLEQACTQLREWQSEGIVKPNVFVTVNLSARQLQDPNLLSDVQTTVLGSGIDPQLLQLEITESVVMQDPEAMVIKLNALKGLGIKLALDDFGTGYSSLVYLKRFPIDVLKIDRAFVSELANNTQDSAIVQTIVGLARALRLKTTAEGIEDRSQWDRLEQLGCDSGQGFLFSRPLKAEAVVDLLARLNQPALQAAA